ncbi:hypothetical protein [Sedimentisphaera salicampi]|uniref:ACT domain-containing protein n=1 Tax=Sedimentisphaera salicampi TaxID=1941349 RepID=A0A1W6LJV1_9BACT|nr:hypothetical protein [Sedimentisphaera salicampi]ARN56057.1 ACT domain-containing protein [Sedimentisphaera salicampi]OXU15790.1 ACT domain-containing protein [Sedimentisphaera salicampi]
MIKQLNVFVENRPGRVYRVTDILTENEIDIKAFTVQDRGEYGLIKMIVDKPDEARLALSERGFACALKDITAVSVPDSPGNLKRLTLIMNENDVNIADVFGFVVQPGNLGVCCMEIHDTLKQAAVDNLKKEGFKLLDSSDFTDL